MSIEYGATRLRSIMTWPVVDVAAETTMHEVAELLATHKVGALLVVDGLHGVVGLVSERDVVRYLAAGANPYEVTAAELMTRTLIAARPDDSVQEVASRMLESGVRHMPVREGEKYIGIVSERDLLDVLRAT
jgi:CBS domain-containing protein